MAREIDIEIKKAKDLSSSQRRVINKYRVQEFGERSRMDFDIKDNQEKTFFLVKSLEKIVAFGVIEPIIVTYQNKKYKIFGFGSGIAIKKGNGFGRLLMAARIAYVKQKGLTGIGFCGRHNLKRFEAYGMKIKKNFRKQFIYVEPISKKEKKVIDGDGIYTEGCDKLVTKMLKSKSFAYCNKSHW